MSVTFMTWTCSRAVLSMVLDVAAELLFSWAVTTALSSRRLSRTRLTFRSVMFPFTERSRVTVTYPRHETESTLSPAETFLMVNSPFALATAHCSEEVRTTVAKSTGCPLS